MRFASAATESGPAVNREDGSTLPGLPIRKPLPFCDFFDPKRKKTKTDRYLWVPVR